MRWASYEPKVKEEAPEQLELFPSADLGKLTMGCDSLKYKTREWDNGRITIQEQTS